MARKTIEVWVAIDEDGDYVTAIGRDEALDAYRDDFSETAPVRLIKITLDVPLPTPLEVTGVVNDGETATLVEAK